MATSSRHHIHPVRTLVVFGVFIGALYVIMAATGSWFPKLGLDLKGGTTVTLTARNETGTGSVDATSLELARGILNQRVNGMGVTTGEVTTSGGNQIIVTVPNIQQDDLVRLVGQTAQLYFRNVYDVGIPTVPQPSVTVSPDAVPSGTATSAPAPTATVPAAAPVVSAPPDPAPSPGPATSAPARPLPNLPTPVPSPRPTAAAPVTPDLATLMAYEPSDRDRAEFAEFVCDGVTPSPTPDVVDQPLIACDASGYKYLLGPALVHGNQVSQAQAVVPANSLNWVVTLEFNSAGASAFGTVTAALAQKTEPNNQFGIVLDGQVISAPRVNESITGGRAEISGNFTQKSAQELANVLRYGALPLAFDQSAVGVVSAKLGGEQLTAGLLAGIIGLGLVLIYSLVYYRGLAVIVVCSLAISGLLIYAMIVLLGQSLGLALNLPGIAGVIVAVGITADSFIIYFERIRDEVREGRSLRTAIETGWVRSRKTILVADSVSLLSAVVLFALAIGEVRGFAFTLGLTTLIDIMIVFWFTKPMVTLLGRTKFFGEGRRFSGFEADHMGMLRPPLHSGRPSAASVGRA